MLKYINLYKGIKLDLICGKMMLMKIKKYLQQTISQKVPSGVARRKLFPQKVKIKKKKKVTAA